MYGVYSKDMKKTLSNCLILESKKNTKTKHNVEALKVNNYNHGDINTPQITRISYNIYFYVIAYLTLSKTDVTFLNQRTSICESNF